MCRILEALFLHLILWFKFKLCAEFLQRLARRPGVSQIKALCRISGPLPSSRRARMVSVRRGSNKGAVRNFRITFRRVRDSVWVLQK